MTRRSVIRESSSKTRGERNAWKELNRLLERTLRVGWVLQGRRWFRLLLLDPSMRLPLLSHSNNVPGRPELNQKTGPEGHRRADAGLREF